MGQQRAMQRHGAKTLMTGDEPCQQYSSPNEGSKIDLTLMWLTKCAVDKV